MSPLVDLYHRSINYLRVSVTDRCNMRCIYCTVRFTKHLSHSDILSYEEIRRVVEVAAELGVRRVRLTGGEPLARPDISALVRLLANIHGIEEVSMTTNGSLFGEGRILKELREAGLRRVNISLDTLNEDRFKQITGTDKLGEVLTGIEMARVAGLNPVKINTVIMRGINDDEIADFAYKTISAGWHVRFIEYMPIRDPGLSVNIEGLSLGETRQIIEQTLGKLEACHTSLGNGPAKYYHLPGASGTVGFIGAVSECFCETCNRFRLTADGHLRPCLLSDEEIDLKAVLRSGSGPGAIKEAIQKVAAMKGGRHHLGEGGAVAGRQMWQIGG